MKTRIAVESVIAIVVLAALSLLASKSLATDASAPVGANMTQASPVLTQGPASDVAALTHSIQWEKLAVSPAAPSF